MMRNLYIFFYIVLLYTLCNINFLSASSASASNFRKKRLKSKKRPSRKKRNMMKRKVHNIIQNIKQNNDSIEKIKEDIIVLFNTIALESIDNNTSDIKKFDWLEKKKIFDKIISIINKDEKIILFNQENDIVKSNNQVVLSKKDIDSLSIVKENNKDQLKKYVQSMQKEVLKNASDSGLKKNDNGDIVDQKDNIIISKKDIISILNTVSDNQDIDPLKKKIFSLFQPHFQKNLKQNNDNNTGDKLINNINNIFNLSVNFNLILKLIKLTKPFNDYFVDIFVIYYLLDNTKFQVENGKYFFEGSVVFKAFNIDDFYKKIVGDITEYSNNLSLVLNNYLDNKQDYSNNDEEMLHSHLISILKNDININTIVNNININIKLLNFDEKLRYILLYIYTLLLYFNTKEDVKSIEVSYKNIFLKYLLEKILGSINIFSDARKIFNNEIFEESLKKSNIDIDYFNDKYNPELKLLLFFNIIYKFLNEKINFNIDDDGFKNILYKKNELENKTIKLLELVEGKKYLLIKNINSELYNENNSNQIYNFIDKAKIIKGVSIKNILLYKLSWLEKLKLKRHSKKIHIPHIILPNSEGIKYLSFFQYPSLIERYKIVIDNYIHDNNNTLYFNYNKLFSKDKYKNYLFSILFDRTKKEKKSTGGNSFEIETIRDFSKKEVIDYIEKFYKLTKMSNEDEDIIELIFIILNVLNFDYYFQSLFKIKNMKDKVKSKIEQLKNTNKLFLEYLISVFNYIEALRSDINNIDKNAHEKVRDEIKETAKNVASIGVTAGLTLGGSIATAKILHDIGFDNIGKATKEVFGKIADVGFNMVQKYPIVAATTAATGAGAIFVYSKFKNMVDRKKSGDEIKNKGEIEIDYDEQENVDPIPERIDFDQNQNLNRLEVLV